MHIISLPLHVDIGKDRPFALNMNTYRNAHYFTLNKAKQAFHDLVGPMVRDLPKLTKIEMTYRLYPRTNRALDVANICSIVDKFFSDTIVENGLLIDDNFNYLGAVQYRFGAIDKTNPRVDVEILDLGLEPDRN